MENGKTPVGDDLVGELLQGVLDEVKTLKKLVGKLATDHEEDFKRLTQTVQTLTPPQDKSASSDLSQILARFERLEQLVRQRPDYQVSQYVRYGGYVFGLMVVLVAGLTWLALDWKGERDHFREVYSTADWRVRFVKQQDPGFYSYIEGLFIKDSVGVSKWIVEQEQADEKRALAVRAAEQAKALSEQANQLEGKGRVKSKKKG